MTKLRASLFFLLLLTVAHGALHAAEPTLKTILFFGDSLTAGFGLDDASTQAFPGRIQQKLITAGLPYRVVNAGLSGETTAGGLRRIDWVLRGPVDIFVLELGANDGLRGLSPTLAAANLQGLLDKVRAKNPAVKLVVAGMELPTSMGEDYRKKFAAIYTTLAQANQATLIPFLLEGVGGVAGLNQPDGIHPTADGHRLVAETVWQWLRPLL